MGESGLDVSGGSLRGINGSFADEQKWSTKSYDFTSERPMSFPKDLAEICSSVVRSIPWKQVLADQVGNADVGEQNWREDYGG